MSSVIHCLFSTGFVGLYIVWVKRYNKQGVRHSLFFCEILIFKRDYDKMSILWRLNKMKRVIAKGIVVMDCPTCASLRQFHFL